MKLAAVFVNGLELAVALAHTRTKQPVFLVGMVGTQLGFYGGLQGAQHQTMAVTMDS